MTENKPLKIVMAPVNISGQPITLVRELQKRGVDISLVQYANDATGHKYGYESDHLVLYNGRNRAEVQIKTIEEALSSGVEIFHFWLRSLFFQGIYDHFTGFDIPIIRSYGRRVVYRFTGQDLRIKSLHMQRNPYHAYKYGYETKIDEYKQRRYIDFLRENVDQFVVQDLELHEFCPEAKIVPRALNLRNFDFVGPVNKDGPLIVHAPSNPEIKGTRLVQKAISELQGEGLKFTYKEISKLSHNDAIALYRSADVIVDQLHIGWYGVLAIEAMALGKTVVTYVRDDLFEKHVPRIPIVNENPDTIKDVLRRVISDYDLRAELGRAARDFAESIHSAERVADTLLDVYHAVPRGEVRIQQQYATLNYFILQYKNTLAAGRASANKKKKFTVPGLNQFKALLARVR
jgi:hypothetical protein